MFGGETVRSARASRWLLEPPAASSAGKVEKPEMPDAAPRPVPSRFAEARQPVWPSKHENHSLLPPMTRLLGPAYGPVEKRLVSVRVCVLISLIAVWSWSAT